MASRIGPYTGADAQIFRGTPIPNAQGVPEETPHLIICDAAGNVVDTVPGNADPTSAARGLVVRNVPGSSVQTIRERRQQDRVPVVIRFNGAAPATAETLLTISRSVGGAAAANAASFGVSAAGKVLRITAMEFQVRSGAAAAAFAQFRVRYNPGGAATAASEPFAFADLGNTEAVIGAARSHVMPIPEGFEVAGAAQIGVTAAAQATSNVLTIALIGYEYTP